MRKALIIFLILTFLPVVVMAQAANINQPANSSCDPVGTNSLFNPLAQAGICNIPDLINWLIKILFAFVGLSATLAVVFGGYQMIVGTQKGEKDKIMAGKNTIFWAITGMIIVIFAYAIIRVVLRTFTNT